MGHRIQVDGVSFAAQTKGFQRDRPATGEGIEDLGGRPRPWDAGFVGGGDQLAGRLDVVGFV